jgi:hypothetical protein
MSNPKEKAKELFDKFNVFSKDNTPDFDKYFDQEVAIRISKYSAKQCALIAVDFALDYVNGDLNEAFDKTLYLLEVKEEIEKL